MGLTLSSSYQNQDFFDSKYNFRKAGEIFDSQDFKNDSSKARDMITDLYQNQDSSENDSFSSSSPGTDIDGKRYKADEPGGGFSGGQSSSNSTLKAPLSGGQSSSNSTLKPPKSGGQSSSGFTLKPPKSGEYYADEAEVKAAWNGVYDEDQYRYYVGKGGNATGADAYHTDMAKYQAQMAIMGDNPHLGLVNQMMHPDWKDHNFNGTYGQINNNADYSTAPTGPGYGPGGKMEHLFSPGGNKPMGGSKYGGGNKKYTN